MNGIEKLSAALVEAGLINKSQDAEEKLGAEDIADMLWLLHSMYPKQLSPTNEDIPQDQHSRHFAQSSSPLEHASLENVSTISEETKPEWQFLGKEAKPPIVPPNNSIDLYLRSSASPSLQDSGERRGMPTLSPSASALPQTLEIARALRPLMRRIPSYTRFLLDEKATTHRIAEALIAEMPRGAKASREIWIPVMKPASMRWLEVALVVDVGASMAPWRQTIDELRILLEHHGAFRDVRTWQLATDSENSVLLYTRNNITRQKAPQEHDPKELIDPTGRRLILLVSDCVSPAWHSGKVQPILDKWGNNNLVTLIQVFPRRMWSRTALRTADIVDIHAKHTIHKNTGMEIEGAKIGFVKDIQEKEFHIKPLLPIPIITLEHEVIANWASMITGAENVWALGAIFYRNLPTSPENILSTQVSNGNARQLIQKFNHTASQTAQTLLKLLSVAPISFPVIRLIQQAKLPGARQIHVAEVFLSGLFEEYLRGETNNPDDTEYDFLPEVREVLRESVSILDESKIIDAVSEHLGNRYGHLKDFRTIASKSSNNHINEGILAINEKSRLFARIVASSWRHRGGIYAQWADNLEKYTDVGSINPGNQIDESLAHDKLAEATPSTSPTDATRDDDIPNPPKPIPAPPGMTVLHYLLKQDKGDVEVVSWSPRGDLLASGSNNGMVHVWNTNQGNLLYPLLKAHSSEIRSFNWSPNGKQLTSRSSDGAIHRWDINTGKLLSSTRGTMGEAVLECWSPNEQLQAISTIGDRRIRIWRRKGGELLPMLKGSTSQITAINWSPDSKLLASGANDGTMYVWEIGKSNPLYTLQGPVGSIISVSWSPDGKLLASSSNAKKLPYASDVYIWRTDNWKRVAKLPDLKGETPVTWHPHPPDPRFLLITTAGLQLGEILIWKLDREILQSA